MVCHLIFNHILNHVPINHWYWLAGRVTVMHSWTVNSRACRCPSGSWSPSSNGSRRRRLQSTFWLMPPRGKTCHRTPPTWRSWDDNWRWGCKLIKNLLICDVCVCVYVWSLCTGASLLSLCHPSLMHPSPTELSLCVDASMCTLLVKGVWMRGHTQGMWVLVCIQQSSLILLSSWLLRNYVFVCVHLCACVTSKYLVIYSDLPPEIWWHTSPYALCNVYNPKTLFVVDPVSLVLAHWGYIVHWFNICVCLKAFCCF